MEISAVQNGDTAEIALSGRFDSNAAASAGEKLLEAVRGASRAVVDVSGLEYVSSAGLRQLLALHKRLGGRFNIVNASRDVMEVFDITGFSSIMKIEKALPRVDIAGLELIASGTCGDCYRLDEDRVLKLYYEGMDEEMVQREKQYARYALVLGLPTAISYDYVACGKRRGVIFELIKARSLASVMSEDIENLAGYVRAFTALMKRVHSVTGDPALLLNRKKYYLDLIDGCGCLPERFAVNLRDMAGKLPDAPTCVHGDLHPNNVMLQEGELVLIDMGDFSIGSPLMDVAHVYNVYALDHASRFEERVSKISRDARRRFWRCFVREYFDMDADAPEFAPLLKEIRKIAAVRSVFYMINFVDSRDDYMSFCNEVFAENGYTC